MENWYETGSDTQEHYRPAACDTDYDEHQGQTKEK